jgi:carboxyl-terminal processing protease
MQPETNTQTAANEAPRYRSARKRRWPKRLAMAVVAVIIFGAGIAVGNSDISWNQPNSVSGNLPRKLNYTSVNQVYQSLKDNYDGKLTETQLEDGLKHGLAASTNDPYTVYFTPKEARDFNNELNNSFSGIGAQLGQDSDKNLEVIAPIAGLPADKAGLKAGDLITSINGANTSGMSVDDAVSRIRGKKGTKVTLQVVRDKSQTLNFTITRDDITLPSVKTKILDGNIGYMQISTFSNDTTSLAQKAADDFQGKHVKGIVLDLRDDPGGLLDAAVHVSSLWLPEGQNLLQEKRGSTVVNSYSALGGDELHGIPTVVLINNGSASASEITAGALHDNKAAVVYGEKSYGKGVVQQLINFKDGSQLKVTVASWHRPDGQNINHKGITPDKTVKISDADAKAGNDTQLQAAEAYLNQ